MKLICPDCGKQYESGKFCLECGAKLQEVAPELVCPSCGFKAKTGKFCPECGTKLTEQVVAPEPQKCEETVERKFNEKDERFAKYYDKKGFPRTIPQEERAIAIEELKPFAEQGISEAQMLLGSIYLNDASKDVIFKGVELLKSAEQSGNKFAYYFLGLGFYYGWEPIVEQDHNEAEKRMLELYKEYNNGDAAQLLALLYTFSQEKCDYKKAFEYATIAAEDDEKDGYAVLGALYLNGWGVERNIELALENYKMAAALGDEGAMNQIGFIFFGNDAIDANPEQAFYWFNEAAQKGSDVGMNNLAYCYQHGIGVKQDEEIAAEWYKKAAELGYVDAMYELGAYYQNVLIDSDKAKMWYQKAAELGHAEAINCLGVLYADKENKFEEAIKCYEKAIELGQPNAYRNLALCYRDGTGVKQNLKKANALLAKAAELGVEDADEIRADLKLSADRDRLDEANALYEKGMQKEAVAIYRELALKDNMIGQAKLGFCLLHGNGIKQHLEKGVEWLKKSADNKNPWACLRLAEVYCGFDYNGKSLPASNRMVTKYLSLAKEYGAEDDEIKKIQSKENKKTANKAEKTTANKGNDNQVSVNEWYVPEGTVILNNSVLPQTSYKWLESIEVIHLPKSIKEVDISEDGPNGNTGFYIFPNLKKIIIPTGEIDRLCEAIWELNYHYWALVWNEDGTHICPEILPYISTEFEATPYNITVLTKNSYWMDTVIISPKCREIAKNAIEKQKKIKRIIMSDSVHVVGKEAFYECKNLTGITLSKNIRVIPKYMLQNCVNLKEIVIPEGVSIIEEGAFNGCFALHTITLPSTISRIDNGGTFGLNPFGMCSALEKIIVPKGMRDHFAKLLGKRAKFIIEA